jgi:hypothetical protein
MKSELPKIHAGFALGSLLVMSLSSCSLVGKGKYASQWEIQTDVPASLNSGRATTPVQESTAGAPPSGNLNGFAQVTDEPLDLPVMENSGMTPIPKPTATPGNPVYQSPPEMLNIPGAETAAADLPYQPVGRQELDPLLAPPPPPVTEEELTLAPSALSAAGAADPAKDSPPAPESTATVATVAPAATSDTPAVPTTAPSIPLLYGKLDLAPFLNPPTPLAVNTPAAP